MKIPSDDSCDLLSFYYLCRTDNNNLLQFGDVLLLWFAFILLSLSYWQQLTRRGVSLTDGCDLLSFYYLCRTDNNQWTVERFAKAVVICFHFTIFVVLTTTVKSLPALRVKLWFAFILLSLSYWQQQKRRFPLSPFVVICFHFTIFVVLTTTESVLFLEFQYVNGNVGTEKMLLLVRCNPVDWRDYIFWLNFRIAPIAARECWRP